MSPQHVPWSPAGQAELPRPEADGTETREVLQRLRVDIPSVRLKVDGLSGGRQQSLAIARAIAFNPKMIILDEPTANLSVPAIERVLELMLELKKIGWPRWSSVTGYRTSSLWAIV